MQAEERPTPALGLPLPRAHLAVADPERFTTYLLCPDHPLGRDKARVFRSALGFELSNAADFRRAILDGVRTAVVKTVREGHGPNTWNCRVDIDIAGPNGETHPVLTAWEATLPPRPPRLLTARLLI